MSQHITVVQRICSGAPNPKPDVQEPLQPQDVQILALILLSALQVLPAARLLRSSSGRAFFGELSNLNAKITSDDFDLNRAKPLLRSALADDPDDELIWCQVSNLLIEATPPPRTIVSSLQQTPWLHNTSSFANSSEHRRYVDGILKEELGTMYVGLPGFRDAYFGGVVGLEAASKQFFAQCLHGSDPFFQDGWKGWPQDANESNVLEWLMDFVKKLAVFNTQKLNTTHQRRLLAQPNTPIQGSTADRKLDVGFVNDLKTDLGSRYHWKQILVPGELKSNSSADTASKAWLDLGRYAREVLAAQDTRRFVLGFTLSSNNKRFIEIERNGSTEQIVIDEVILRARCVAGRAATCWKAHPEGHPETPLVIKDLWQYPERDEEGDLLYEVTDKGVVNVARYYHHETVQVHKTDDDIWNNVRHRLDITLATNYRPGLQTSLGNMARDAPWKGRSSNSRKRLSSQSNHTLPPSKRSSSASPTKAPSTPPNRVHRRIILQDYGKPIYKASSRSALLAALVGCIEGHESLLKAGILHRDISINNLMINEDSSNPSWPAFLIDLDLAIRNQRQGASGARGKTGTRAFMAVGGLLGEQHSFMHVLESFFWVLFWICIHYNEDGKDVGPTEFDSRNYESASKLVRSKKGEVTDEEDFLRNAGQKLLFILSAIDSMDQ
ncbi:hypothetical protein CMUS01_05785 [Colletotrichum musicola]|uniref:non-specific serine/threonine protein kinase n=1 Tax=Colletotrichum musicola TaxID=2175873 RepID=A0A8H6NK36_9PEZI|nr:hypothetical protein CMUS01_05785 [Colletotrichum musicola]